MRTPDNYRHVLMRPDVRICLDRTLSLRQLQPSEATLILNSWERGLELDRWRSKNYLGKPPETAASYLGVKAIESFSFYTRATVSGLDVYMGLGTNDLIT